MRPITELTVFSTGPAKDYRTWSNVPFLFTESLRARGIRVNTVDVDPSHLVEKIFNRTIRLGWRLIYPRSTYTYFRSWLHYMTARARIRNAYILYPNSQVDIFLTYSFSGDGQSEKPVVLLGDWPYGYFINYFRDRQPDFMEARSIAREGHNIEAANLVISLFQTGTHELKQRYHNKNIHYLGHAINAPSIGEDPAIPEAKADLFNLMFIGDEKYIEGLRVLIRAYKILKGAYPKLTLSIVGQTISRFEELPEGVSSYGYLDKGQESDRILFYSLLKQARIVVNTTPLWGGFSSVLEALAYYTPVVVFPFHEIVQLFGMDNDFISYCEENTPELLADRIRILLNHPNFQLLALRAHAAVEDMTWNNYVGRLLALMDSTL